MLDRIEMSHTELLETCSKPIKFAGLIHSLSTSGYESLFSILNREQAIQFLHDGTILSRILRTLLQDRRMTLLTIIGYDILRELIKTRTDFGEILKSLPNQNYNQLIHGLGYVFVKSIIKDGSSLGYIMRMLPKEHHSILLNALGSENVINIVSSESESSDGLNLLFQSDQTSFVDAVYAASQQALHKRKYISSCVYTKDHATLFSGSRDSYQRIQADLDDIKGNDHRDNTCIGISFK